ncbi:pyruvate decarboxylase 2 isoform X2 [Physcomitrium patens]|uniref:pyruvate decarboxylase 2 isoform X2 n=1 Tax=Physcomitrium patens TaxID=3218 RepID=UPI000D166BF3|nr:pyruvate decarboxylase 2-like isoform X2 [Physcomitrium patens]|eukprot:XP_024400201.1 pyruvate decarboxylase 2-like isoform X2 [Physcomitrella patens]
MSRPEPVYPVTESTACLGRHLARRLVEIGCNDIFTVPGDFNLVLLDHLISEPGINNIGCCNEINAGYAADGYARWKGVGCVVVTFTVGGLSVINSIAGAYSENLPVICIVGGPNSNDFGTNRILHHTIGVSDFSQEARCFQAVTCFQAVINCLDDAHQLVDRAISTCLLESKPVYISVSCNLAGIEHPSFTHSTIPYAIKEQRSNKTSLEAALDAAVKFLNHTVKPVLVGGPKLRLGKAKEAFQELVEASGYAYATMPSAKGQPLESHPHFIGTYWGAVSSPFCLEIVESADAYIFVGPIFNDYSSVGYSLFLKKDHMIVVNPDRVQICGKAEFGCVLMKDFCMELSKRITRNSTSFENYKRIHVPEGTIPSSGAQDPLRVNVLFKHIQGMLSHDTAVLAETGDSWFNCQKLKLPAGCGYEFQMQYGSIGWSVGALLGYSQALKGIKRVIACIGDGHMSRCLNYDAAKSK